VASRAIIAEVVGTGQKERPKVEDRMKMTSHVFGVMVVVSGVMNVCGGVAATVSICSMSLFSSDGRRRPLSWTAVTAMMVW